MKKILVLAMITLISQSTAFATLRVLCTETAWQEEVDTFSEDVVDGTTVQIPSKLERKITYTLTTGRKTDGDIEAILTRPGWFCGSKADCVDKKVFPNPQNPIVISGLRDPQRQMVVNSSTRSLTCKGIALD